MYIHTEETEERVPTTVSDIQFYLRRFRINTKDSNLLLEAYRRKMMFHPDKELRKAWLGLGMPSRYKSDYFTTTDGKSPRLRCNDWWVLSEKGVVVMESLIAEFPFPTDPKEREALNLRIFKL